jgi:hypothetical protein
MMIRIIKVPQVIFRWVVFLPISVAVRSKA